MEKPNKYLSAFVLLSKLGEIKSVKRQTGGIFNDSLKGSGGNQSFHILWKKILATELLTFSLSADLFQLCNTTVCYLYRLYLIKKEDYLDGLSLLRLFYFYGTFPFKENDSCSLVFLLWLMSWAVISFCYRVK